MGSTPRWRSAGLELELVHPGPDFAHPDFRAAELYRFEVVPGGCIQVLPPADAAPQPDPYPLGPDTCRKPR